MDNRNLKIKWEIAEISLFSLFFSYWILLIFSLRTEGGETYFFQDEIKIFPFFLILLFSFGLDLFKWNKFSLPKPHGIFSLYSLLLTLLIFDLLQMIRSLTLHSTRLQEVLPVEERFWSKHFSEDPLVHSWNEPCSGCKHKQYENPHWQPWNLGFVSVNETEILFGLQIELNKHKGKRQKKECRKKQNKIP